MPQAAGTKNKNKKYIVLFYIVLQGEEAVLQKNAIQIAVNVGKVRVL